MKIYILGPGAMGTLYGTELIKNNCEVIFFGARPQLIEEI